ncbi:Endocytosis and vacuole integrity protein [Gnomoniopsis smithogilvyi]|uniref:Endocytosis and vacuole integrity protein n=1 Tax=Gnomoniopsis smithogilvyi TaxID=1191159 RepID=A0A9W9CZB9_9PEZI|nr:Endocytosis and vacuole integrity protein [Gnomoniopsis smithogilvyi]
MSAQLLTTELNNLITESKRKHQDLRQAAEKSLEELKSLRVSNEAQFGAELSKSSNFANPFIIACGTKNAKFTGIAIVCLQRLIVAKALPRSKLSPTLEALREGTSAGLDVQLKILQALPSLLQNYSTDIKDDLLITALNICFILQSSKNAIVNNTSAATLQQLIVSVFEKVVAEDKNPDAPAVGEAPAEEGTVQLKAAALDAYRIFNDLCLLTQSQRPEYLRFSGFRDTFGLELIESALTNHAAIFATHPEQVNILRTKVMPFIIKSLSAKPNFAASVRLFRILYTLLRRHLALIPKESGEALEILTQILDQDTTLWKRSLCMEVFRGIFAEPALIRRIFRMFDGNEGEKDILKSLTATFVRVSTEKPVVIGLGHQSTIPVANPYSTSADQAVLDASGVSVSVIAGTVGGNAHDTGISTHWSSTRVPCIDQLDKTDPPGIPESYVYSLTLACITSLSEGLAKFILPLTVPGDRSRRRVKPSVALEGSEDRSESPSPLDRSSSFKKNPVPVNPLTLKEHPLFSEIETCAAIIDECWPAILATCSTFLYAALDSEYYHGLVRAFQRFAHVAGLLQLATPRDAFLTTLGKAAVPPNVFTACLNAGQSRQPSSSPASESAGSSILGNARGLLSVENLVSQGNAPDKSRSQSFDASATALNTRNLLCLRALLNLGIALGPTLSTSWQIVLETLQQADFVLFATAKAAGRTPIAAKGPDPNADKEASTLLANFGTEIKSVETAASRLFESTIDFPNDAFLEVVNAVCGLLEKRPQSEQPSAERDGRPETIQEENTELQSPTFRKPKALVSSGPLQTDHFALAKLGDLASINLERLLTHPPDVSGWNSLTAELNLALGTATASAPVRTRAAEVLVRLVLEAANATANLAEDFRGQVQLRLLEAFRDALQPLQDENRERTVASHATDIEIHRVVLEGLKSILENCGETLVNGWDLTFDIIDSIFIVRTSSTNGGDVPRSLIARSTKLIKASFGSLQLICSDFLSSLPNSCFLNLVDTLYKFCSQDDDLNVALTTVTFFWAISDFLSGRSNSMSITEEMVGGGKIETLIELASHPDKDGSSAALWMLLLLRLTAVTTDQRLELRNSAIQTLLRIVHAYGSSLGPQAWSICTKYVIFRLLSSIEERLHSVKTEDVNHAIQSEWYETAVVIVQGVSNLLANYLDVLSGYPEFTALWQDLIGHFATMLDFKVLDINSATFSSLGGILSKCEEGGKSSFNQKTIDLVWDLWSRSIPLAEQTGDGKFEDNQKCLISWVEALLELYRLIQIDLTVDRVRRLLTLLQKGMLEATTGSYASDIEYVTPLQGKILDVFKLVRTDIAGVPSAMISQVAEFVALAFDKERAVAQQGSSSKRTYIAMSKESMNILQYHVLSNATDADIYVSGAFTKALGALAKPIIFKYDFPIVTRSEQPWRAATTSALTILESTLPQVKAAKISQTTVQGIWYVVVSISNGIISANYDNASTDANILSDQEFDITSFRTLRELIIPSLGSSSISDTTRRNYAEGLFRTSIIHSPAPAESEVISSNNNQSLDSLRQALTALSKPRNGRTIDPKPTKRKEISYVCLDELFDIVSAHDENTAGPEIVLQPPTPRFPPSGKSSADTPLDPLKSPVPDTTGGSSRDIDDVNGTSESTHAFHVRLARTAAPYLVLRCALTLRAFVADQPLRGRMPQPLSQRRELERILKSLIGLHSEPEALGEDGKSGTAKHLYGLYPLLVRAAMVNINGGDERVVGLVARALEVVGGELGLSE